MQFDKNKLKGRERGNNNNELKPHRVRLAEERWIRRKDDRAKRDAKREAIKRQDR